MEDSNKKLVKDLFPELGPAEVDQAGDNIREFLESFLDIFQETNNKEVVEDDQNSPTTTDVTNE